MGQIADVIVPNLRTTIGLAGLMLKDVKPETFARFPVGHDGKPVRTNHPAFVYGHLATYPARMLEMMGKDRAPAAVPEEFEALFKAGVECKDDPEGTIYPKMDAIVSAFNRGYEAVLKALPEVSEDVFARPNPIEGRFREMCPTVGVAVSFLCLAHPMMHLGQVSAWRRMFGLGSAM